MSEKRILVVDDSHENLELLSVLIERNGWEHETADRARAALKMLEEAPFDLVMADLMMPEMNGLELLAEVKKQWPSTDVVIVTAFGSIPTAIEAIKKGAYSYLLRPFEPEEVVLLIRKIFEVQGIRHENVMLREELNRFTEGQFMVGKSYELKKTLRLAESVAPTNSTVLIQGESGVGKELLARAIHYKSPRADQPFITVSCAALPEALLESELFGHEKGSFTGAMAMRKGRFEMADMGTLFLDEIGEISPSTQVKLLRVLQELEFTRVGGTKTIRTNTRIVSATNKDLAEEVSRGNFRDDLFYRLNVITLTVPPLRDRPEDIPALAYHFLKKYREEMNKDIVSITDEALAVMAAHPWPGNIRELENVMERAVVICAGKSISLADLPEGMTPAGVAVPTTLEAEETLAPLRVARGAWEKEYLQKALGRNNGNISRTAEAIGLARKNLQEKIKQYGIDPRLFLLSNDRRD
ncbi:MAG: sigma-54 dependent transcriptional regulator [Nitrospinota bacterium]|nr:sigma-54 dependent transcriptional regulator [Nitrospinota bacterium]MDH5755602.1 sigma-54 dependent transcriptional regulator [Nitrospinota bacterium]